MTYITRNEFNARIETIEVKMDARMESMFAKLDEFVAVQSERDRAHLERERAQEQAWIARDRLQERARIEREIAQERARLERDNARAIAQQERDKAHIERDKRYELMAVRALKASEGAEEAARRAASVKANYWAATAVHFLGMVALLAGAYCANQANVMVAMQTTLAALQSGKDFAVPAPRVLPSATSAE